MRRRMAAALALAALALPGAAAAAECPRTTLGDVEDEVMCPVCGTPLSLATEAPQANRERALISRLVNDCRSKEEIKSVLAAQFGDRVLALPGDEGFDLAAYLVPALAVLFGTAAVAASALTWRRSRRREPPDAQAAGPGTDASERLQSDLDRYEL